MSEQTEHENKVDFKKINDFLLGSLEKPGLVQIVNKHEDLINHPEDGIKAQIKLVVERVASIEKKLTYGLGVLLGLEVAFKVYELFAKK